ncbi:MAG: hypothetical protein JST39_02375 [Bacteroidetes bacterium]|nr:hypothetical protein [Bacteroidota bacterium]
MQFPVLMLAFVLCGSTALGQKRVEGTVYDRTQTYPMPRVSVITTSGAGTMTDSAGHYVIRLNATDSLYFSYLGKTSSKIPARMLDENTPFDMSLDTPYDTLANVYVGPRSYRQDSLANRRDYQKIFDYDGSGYLSDKRAANNATFGIGLDMDMLFDGKRNKRMDNFRQFLETQEHEKYIDHRFTKAVVRRVTGLQPPAIDSFMRMYRPSYEFVLACTTDIELFEYIKTAGKSFESMWRQDHPDSADKKPMAATPAKQP